MMFLTCRRPWRSRIIRDPDCKTRCPCDRKIVATDSIFGRAAIGVSNALLELWEARCAQLSKFDRSDTPFDIIGPPGVLGRGGLLLGRTDPRYATPACKPQHASIESLPRVIICLDAAFEDTGNDPPSTAVYMRENIRLNMYFEATLTRLQPELWSEVTRQMCVIIDGDTSDLNNLCKLIETYKRSQAALNLMPQAALVCCVGRLLALTRKYAEQLRDLTLATIASRSSDCFERAACSLVELVLGQPMVFLITWKVRSAPVAEIWLDIARIVADYVANTVGVDVLVHIVVEAYPRALHLAAQWLRYRELQYKVAFFMLFVLTKKFAGIGDEARRSARRTLQWLSVIQRLHRRDRVLVTTGNALRAATHEFLDHRLDARPPPSMSCNSCGRKLHDVDTDQTLRVKPGNTSSSELHLCLECFRRRLTINNPPHFGKSGGLAVQAPILDHDPGSRETTKPPSQYDEPD